MRNILVVSLLLLLLPGKLLSQKEDTLVSASCEIRDGRMYVQIDKKISRMGLKEFLEKYNLSDIGIADGMHGRNFGPLTKEGWRVEFDNKQKFVISKPIGGVSRLDDPAKRLALTEEHPNTLDLFPPRNDDLVYGSNRFMGKYPFAVKDSLVTFFMRGHPHAGRVLLAGSFTGWQMGALAMTRTDSGWICVVRLDPGKYWYKFIIDGDWTIDRDNDIEERDPNGNNNSVFYVPNTSFTLPGHTNATNVYLSGSFNNWKPDELPMVKGRSGWTIHLYLAEGTHTYKFVVDGRWYDGSVLRLGKPHLFFLKGYLTARAVALGGSFNGWNSHDLLMRKTAAGWTLPYTLGPGNYQYGFFVDGNWIKDPANAFFVVGRQTHLVRSFLIVQPNYTFRLQGHADAKQVCVAGDFSEWTPDGLKMTREGDDWVFPIHLSYGKHLYKFVIDGKWVRDPDNPLWEGNAYDSDNSVLWMEDR